MIAVPCIDPLWCNGPCMPVASDTAVSKAGPGDFTYECDSIHKAYMHIVLYLSLRHTAIYFYNVTVML
jgi:hypothetical protein